MAVTTAFMLVALASMLFSVPWMFDRGTFTLEVTTALMLAALDSMLLSVAAIVESG